MKNIFNKILLILMFFVLFYQNTTANNLVSDIEIESKKKIVEELRQLTSDYAINLDVIIISKNKDCAWEYNFIDCTIMKNNLSSDYFLWIDNTLREVETYRLDRVENQDWIINEKDLREIQDNNLHYLKDNKQEEFILSFIKDIDSFLRNKCNIYSDWNKCKINILTENYIKTKREDSIRYYINLAITILWIIIIIWWSYFWYKLYIFIKVKKLSKNLFLDLQTYKLFVKNNTLLLKNDKENILEKIINITDVVEIFIWNKNKSLNRIEQLILEFNSIKDEVKNKEVSKKDLEGINDLFNEINNIIL